MDLKDDLFIKMRGPRLSNLKHNSAFYYDIEMQPIYAKIVNAGIKRGKIKIVF